MELGTFAAVFEAALGLEERLAHRYEAQSDGQPEEAGQIYRALAKDSEKRIRRLERVRRETVTEMILIPIEGLSLSADLVALTDSDSDTPLSLAEAKALEASAGRFYTDAAARIGQDEAARALKQMAKGNARRLAQLKSL